ncbi:MAG: phosphoglucosamine mutase [Halobacteriota archaeon]
MFGTSGVRGPIGETITAETALRLGRALGTDTERVLVGRDTRESGRILEHAFTAGLLERGVTVQHAQVESTPTIARGASWMDADAAVAITGSHNPKGENGLKFFDARGQPFDRGSHRALLRRANGQSVPLDPEAHTGREEQVGSLSHRHASVLQNQFPRLELAVVVDLGNGAGRLTADVLDELGCEVVSINGHPDGSFPGRESEPTEANCMRLSQTVRATGADLGIAHDADADRLVAVEDTGRVVPGDALLALFCERVAKAGGDLAVPVNASSRIDEIGATYDSTVLRTPVGDSFVAAAVSGSVAFGGESSGTAIWADECACSDAHYAACRLASLVMRAGALSERIGPFDEYVIDRHRYRTRDAEAVIDRVRNEVLRRYERVDTTDGVKLRTDRGWALIRASRTEPLVRVTVETDSESHTANLLETIGTLVVDAIDTDDGDRGFAC